MPPKNASKRKKSTQWEWFTPERGTENLDISVSRLRSEGNRMSSKIDWFESGGRSSTGKKKKSSPSLFNRTMDVLSRPLYASANIAESLVDDDKGGNVLGAAWKGLSGKNKTTFDKVLKSAGMAGGWQRSALGFAGDVLLDPTTYFGAGLVRKGSQTALRAAGTKAFVDTLKVARNSPDAVKAARAAVDSHLLANPGENISKKVLERIERDALDDFAKTQAEVAQRKALRSAEEAGLGQPGKVEFRFAGKKLGESERLYELGSKAVTPLRESALGDNLARKFSTGATFTDGTNAMRKMRRSEGVFDYDQFLKNHGWDDLTRGLSKKEAENLSDMIERGIEPPDHLKPVADKYREMMDELWQEAEELRMIPGKVAVDEATGLEKYVPNRGKMDNYVYHYYKRSTRRNQPLVTQFKTSRRKAISGDKYTPGQERKIPTLADAKAAGLDPEMDIRAIVKNRAAKHFESRARQQFVQDVVDNFGVSLDKGNKALKRQFNPKQNGYVPLKKIIGEQDGHWIDPSLHVDKDIADSLGRVYKVVNDPRERENFVRLYDSVLSKWKFMATVPNPGHHMRNAISDIAQNYYDGVVTALPYAKATKIMASRGGAKGADRTIQFGRKGRMDVNDVQELFERYGAKPGYMKMELPGEGRNILPKGGLRGWSEYREEYFRLAHFVDALEKELPKGYKIPKQGLRADKALQDAAKRATDRVKKWNVDYTDMTDWETHTAKRLIPFYTWMRKNIPLQVEAMFMRPGKVVGISKAQRLMAQLTGDPDETTPEDLIPKWLRDAAAFRVGTSSRGNPMLAAPALPIMDPFRFTGSQEEVGRELLGNVTPALKIPFEMGTKQSLFSGAPIESNSKYATEQVPMARLLMAALQNGDKAPEEQDLSTKIINYLSGAGLYEVTPNRMRSELRRQQDPMQARLRKQKEKARKENGL